MRTGSSGAGLPFVGVCTWLLADCLVGLLETGTASSVSESVPESDTSSVVRGEAVCMGLLSAGLMSWLYRHLSPNLQVPFAAKLRQTTSFRRFARRSRLRSVLVEVCPVVTAAAGAASLGACCLA